MGVTRSLFRRVWEHKIKDSLTINNGIYRLVYHESFYDIHNTIARKEIQSGSRKKKTALIKETNLHRKDLSADWYW